MGNLYELTMAGSGGVDDGDGDSWFGQNLNEKYSRDWLELLHNSSEPIQFTANSESCWEGYHSFNRAEEERKLETSQPFTSKLSTKQSSTEFALKPYTTSLQRYQPGAEAICHFIRLHVQDLTPQKRSQQQGSITYYQYIPSGYF
ncbi:hypothetical protein LA080_015916 [Diaporthe eres]|nr:hypothetical protein LA080_015916 [Diaporthe eres]